MITQISPTPGDPAIPEAIRDAHNLLGVVDEAQAVALKEWLALTEDTSIPHRSGLKPERIVPALPASTLVEVDWNGAQPAFRPRIEGCMVAVAFGESRGRLFEETYAPAHLEQVLPAFREAAHRGRVTLTPVAAKTAAGEPFVYTRLLLPLTDENGRVVRILAVYSFDLERLAALTEPLDIGDVITTNVSRRALAGSMQLRTG